VSHWPQPLFSLLIASLLPFLTLASEASPLPPGWPPCTFLPLTHPAWGLLLYCGKLQKRLLETHCINTCYFMTKFGARRPESCLSLITLFVTTGRFIHLSEPHEMRLGAHFPYRLAALMGSKNIVLPKAKVYWVGLGVLRSRKRGLPPHLTSNLGVHPTSPVGIV
jgi:hypothetical protein